MVSRSRGSMGCAVMCSGVVGRGSSRSLEEIQEVGFRKSGGLGMVRVY